MTKNFVIWINIFNKQGNQPVLNSQFDVSKLQKQLQSAGQIHLYLSVKFGLLILIVCVTVSHNLAFNSTTR